MAWHYGGAPAMSDAAAQNLNDPPSDVTEARRLIQDSDLTFGGDKCIAAHILMENCAHDLQITLGDMLRCLDYGGAIAEVGARCLYVRTGRDGLGWQCSVNGLPFVVERADWERWLREHGLLDDL